MPSVTKDFHKLFSIVFKDQDVEIRSQSFDDRHCISEDSAKVGLIVIVLIIRIT